MIEDLRSNGVDVCSEGTYISAADVEKSSDWLFGAGSTALLDYLECHMQSAKS